MSIPELPTVRERVAVDVAVQQRHDPGWWRADAEPPVYLGRPNMGSYDGCILGQRCPMEIRQGDYTPYHCLGAFLAGTQPWEGMSIDNWAVRHGFQAPRFSFDQPAEFTALTAEWRWVITSLTEQA